MQRKSAPQLAMALLALGALGVGTAAFAADPPAPPAGAKRMKHDLALHRIDANSDGFVTRDEARAGAEKMFEHLDRNTDGKLDASDRPARGERHRKEQRVEKDGDKMVERRVEIRRDHRGPRGPMGGPPMAMMIFGHGGEADVNGDKALSKSEFVNQQLRFFDAADVNGDGKVKFDRPQPPEPPAPPTPPEPR